MIQARQPGIVCINKRKKKCLIKDVVIPRVQDVVLEKVDKYQDLRTEVQKLWNVKATVIPVIIGPLGKVSNNLVKHLNEINSQYW